MTLVLILMLALMAIELYRSAVPRLALSRAMVRRSTLGKSAEAGVGYARHAAGEAALRRARGEEETAWTLDDPLFEEMSFTLEDVVVTVTVEDEERRFPLLLLADEVAAETPAGGAPERENGSGPDSRFVVRDEMLEAFDRLMAGLEIPEGWRREAAHSLADWIEAPEFSRRAFGAGRSYYLISGYEPRGGPPRTGGELLLVRGFTPEVSERVLPFLSHYAGAVNLNTAPPEVLRAVFRPAAGLDADFLVAARPFATLEEMARKTGRDVRRALAPGFAGSVSVSSSVFSVVSTALAPGGESVTIYAVFELLEAEEDEDPGNDGQDPEPEKRRTRILYWHEEAAGLRLPGLVAQ